MRAIARKALLIRGDRGQQVAEFAAALTLLIVFVFVPLIDLGIIPIRYALASSLLDTFVGQLARLEKVSEAYALLDGDSGPRQALTRIGGIKVNAVELVLTITSSADPSAHVSVDGVGGVPPAWLPDGKNCPCQYMLEVTTSLEVSPLITIPWGGKAVPGLNAPFAITLKGSSPWENLGRNPVSRGYFLNE